MTTQEIRRHLGLLKQLHGDEMIRADELDILVLGSDPEGLHVIEDFLRYNSVSDSWKVDGWIIKHKQDLNSHSNQLVSKDHAMVGVSLIQDQLGHLRLIRTGELIEANDLHSLIFDTNEDGLKAIEAFISNNSVSEEYKVRHWIDVRRQQLKRKEDTAYKDNAMNANSPKDKVGGIDLNPKLFEINAHGSNPMIHFANLPMEGNLNTIEGLVPVIIHIAPIINIPLLLGEVPFRDLENSKLTST